MPWAFVMSEEARGFTVPRGTLTAPIDQPCPERARLCKAMANSISEVYVRKQAYCNVNKKNHDEGLVADALEALRTAQTGELASEQALIIHVREHGC